MASNEAGELRRQIVTMRVWRTLVSRLFVTPQPLEIDQQFLSALVALLRLLLEALPDDPFQVARQIAVMARDGVGLAMSSSACLLAQYS